MRQDTRAHIEQWTKQVVEEHGEVPHIRMTSRMKHLAKEGYVVGDLTVEISTSTNALPSSGMVEEILLDLYNEAQHACTRVNIDNGEFGGD